MPFLLGGVLGSVTSALLGLGPIVGVNVESTFFQKYLWNRMPLDKDGGGFGQTPFLWGTTKLSCVQSTVQAAVSRQTAVPSFTELASNHGMEHLAVKMIISIQVDPPPLNKLATPMSIEALWLSPSPSKKRFTQTFYQIIYSVQNTVS